MSRLVLILTLLLALLAASAPAALGDATSLPDVEDEVMCPTCNVPLSIAESPQANEQRNFIRELIAEGRTKQQVKNALVAEYGQDVLAMPEEKGFNLAVYLVPIVAALLGILALVLLLPRWRRRNRAAAAETPATPAPSEADLARLDADLARYDT